MCAGVEFTVVDFFASLSHREPSIFPAGLQSDAPCGAFDRVLSRHLSMESSREADLSAKQARSQASSWFPCSHGDQRWCKGHRSAPFARSQASVSLIRRAVGPVATPRDSTMERLRKRRDFLKVQKGRRFSTGLFSLEALTRNDDAASRVGFTVSKKVSMSAVVRNRIRRRLKEAMRLEAANAPDQNLDLVLVARPAALRVPFPEMRGTLVGALEKLSKNRQSPAETSKPIR